MGGNGVKGKSFMVTFSGGIKMERGKQYCCLIVSDHQADIPPALTQNDEIECITAKNTEAAFAVLRSRFMDCLILPANRGANSVCEEFSAFTAQFPSLPILVIINGNQIELACRLGQLGAKNVISGADFYKAEKRLRQILEKLQLRGGVNSLLKNLQPESELINRSLHLIEDKYLQYKYVEDFSDELGIAKETLSGGFKRECGVGLKRLLLALKIEHAVYLLTNSNLNIKTISEQIGFKIPQRFNECFRKVFGIAPSDFRKNNELWTETDEKMLEFLGKIKKT